jgi:hypothetical protein
MQKVDGWISIFFSSPLLSSHFLVRNVYVCEYSIANLQMLQASICKESIKRARLWHYVSSR